MEPIERILFPTDFSETAEMAKTHAAALARSLGAEIVVLHVRTIFRDDPQLLARHLNGNGKPNPESRPEPEPLPVKLAKDLKVRHLVMRDISPAEAILRCAETEKAGLVVMGTHGRTGLKHFMLGSVAEEVVREAGCPVITVGPNSKLTGRYRRVLAGFDFSDHSRAAVRVAAVMARHLNARLGVLFVLQQELHPAYEVYFESATVSAIPAIEKQVREGLGPICEDAGLTRFDVTVTMGAGKTAREIGGFVQDSRADLLVLGTHGLSGLSRLLLGSTSEQVMRIAGCPVMTVRPAVESRAAPAEDDVKPPLRA